MPTSKEKMQSAFKDFNSQKVSPKFLAKKIIAYVNSSLSGKNERLLDVTVEMEKLKKNDIDYEIKEGILLDHSSNICDPKILLTFETSLKQLLVSAKDKYLHDLSAITRDALPILQEQNEFLVNTFIPIALMSIFIDHYHSRFILFSETISEEDLSKRSALLEGLWKDFIEKIRSNEIKLDYVQNDVVSRLTQYDTYLTTFDLIRQEANKPSGGMPSRPYALRIAMKKVLNIGAENIVAWKTFLSSVEIFFPGLQQKAVIPAAIKRGIEEPFTEARIVKSKPSNNGECAIAGTTSINTNPNLALDSMMLLGAAYSNGSAMAVGSGLNRQVGKEAFLNKAISRFTYFANKHLVRLANTFLNPTSLYDSLSVIFTAAVNEARAKARGNEKEKATATLVKTFKREDGQYDVVVGSKGNSLVFAWDPNTKKMTMLVTVHEAKMDEKCLDQDGLQAKQEILPKNAVVFVLTREAWSHLPNQCTEINPGVKEYSLDEKKMNELLSDFNQQNPFATATQYAQFISSIVLQGGEKRRIKLKNDFEKLNTVLEQGLSVGEDFNIAVARCANLRKLADLRELVLNPALKASDPLVAKICAGLTQEELKDIFMEVAQEGHDEANVKGALHKVFQHLHHFEQKKLEYKTLNTARWRWVGLTFLLLPLAIFAPIVSFLLYRFKVLEEVMQEFKDEKKYQPQLDLTTVAPVLPEQPENRQDPSVIRAGKEETGHDQKTNNAISRFLNDQGKFLKLQFTLAGSTEGYEFKENMTDNQKPNKPTYSQTTVGANVHAPS